MKDISPNFPALELAVRPTWISSRRDSTLLRPYISNVYGVCRSAQNLRRAPVSFALGKPPSRLGSLGHKLWPSLDTSTTKGSSYDERFPGYQP